MWLLQQVKPMHDLQSNYEIGKHIEEYDGYSPWTLYEAKSKETEKIVSIFKYECNYRNEERLVRARQSLKKLKTLRYPSIIKYIDSYETDNMVVIVTEHVVPLSLFVNSEEFQNYTKIQKEFFITYGLFSIAECLNFLNEDCQLNHNNINMHSIQITDSRCFKIGTLDYTSQVCLLESFERHDSLCDKYTPPENLPDAKFKLGRNFSPDSWGFGCLIWEIFNNPLSPSSSVRTLGKIPKVLGPLYNKLVQTNPRQRISPKKFVDECKSSNIFFDNEIIDTVHSLENILVKEADEITKYISIINARFGDVPENFCKYKILSELMRAYEFKGANLEVLDVLFAIMKLFKRGEHTRVLTLIIVKLFSSRDRKVRTKLLNNVNTYIDNLSTKAINDQIFQPFVKGLLDNNQEMIELTLKVTPIFATKLRRYKLNYELIREHLSELMRNKNSDIRKSTLACLAAVTSYSDTVTKDQFILPRFTELLTDKDIGIRYATLVALHMNDRSFKKVDLASKIMPLVSIVCLDSNDDIRNYAIKAMRSFLVVLEENRPDMVVENESESTDASSYADALASSICSFFHDDSNREKNHLTRQKETVEKYLQNK